MFVVAKEPTPDKAPKNAPPPKVSLVKQTVTVPDLWNGELNTSSVIIAERIDPLPAPLTPQQQGERPYALGTMEIVPALSTKFSKKNELSTFLLIYNAKIDAANKPDVSVEYNFYAKAAGAEKFFNKTNPQNLNAQTLPPQFDFAAGHQLQSGQAVPLASFPEGDYRLEIKVTDKIANKTLTRDVNFSVSRFVNTHNTGSAPGAREHGSDTQTSGVGSRRRHVGCGDCGDSRARKSSARPCPPVASTASLASGSIFGVVLDERGLPVAGVVVSALGATTVTAVTDKAGQIRVRRGWRQARTSFGRTAPASWRPHPETIQVNTSARIDVDAGAAPGRRDAGPRGGLRRIAGRERRRRRRADARLPIRRRRRNPIPTTMAKSPGACGTRVAAS